ncbi:MAG: triose-phosphate isomerase [Methanomassiliicoccales archaeon]
MFEINYPLIIVNFKAYREAEGISALNIAKACKEVMEESGICIVACPPMVELSRVASSIKVPIMAQHVDPKAPGAATGWVTAEMVKSAGAYGTLINHSEHRLTSDVVAKIIPACTAIGLITCVCSDTPIAAQNLASLRPSMVAIEPPELIGGDISVTEARPEVVLDSVEAVGSIDKTIPVLCGAGVKTGKDVKKALDLGAKGVLLSSGVVKAKDPKKALRELVKLI